MGRVTWQKLVLRGFGCYREEKTLEFEEGLNVYVAPNEEGKSTLVMGLIAVLYGLPSTSDPAAFGKARYQNWDGSTEFSGELAFRVDGRDYLIRRDFASDRIALLRREGARWAEIAGGEHRARARRPNLPYIQALADLIGLESRELFVATFCLSQPLVRVSNLDDDILRLLSGSATSYQKALEILAASLKELTRYTSDRGVTRGNQRSARKLEQLDEEIASLQIALEQHREALDALPSMQEELARKQDQRQELLVRLREKEAALRAWGEWRAMRLRYDGALKEQSRLEQALDQSRDLAKRENELRQELAFSYPEMQAAPPETGSALGSLKELEEKIETRKEEVAAAARALAGQQEEIEALQARLREEFAAVDGRPDLLQKHRELVLRLQQREELLAQLASARRAQELARAQLAGLSEWEKLGSSPAALLPERRRLAQTLLQEWAEYQDTLQEIRTLDAELAGDLAWFETASPQALEACRDYPAEKEKRARKREQAEAALQKARERLTQHESDRQAWRQEFGPMAELGEEAARAVEEKLALLQERKRLAEKAREVRQGKEAVAPWQRWWAWVGALLVLFLTFTAWPLAVAVALACGLWWWLGRRRQAREAGQALAAIEQEMGKNEAAMGELERYYPFLAGWGETDLIRAQERWQLCRARKQALEAQEQGLPGPEEVAALEEALARARAEEEELDSLTRDLRMALSDVAQGYARWQLVKGRRQELHQRLLAWARNEFGCDADAVSAFPLSRAGERWQKAADLAAATGAPVATVGQLVTWLAGLDEAWWDQALARAAAWERASQELKTACDTEASLTSPGGEGTSVLERLERAIAALRQDVAPFDEGVSQEDLQALVSTCQELRARLQSLLALAQQEEQRLESMKAELAGWQEQRDKLTQDLAPLLGAAGGRVQLALERWQDYEKKKARADLLAQNLVACLAGQGVTSVDELRTKALDTANQAAQILARWQEVIAAHPGLPEANLEVDVEEAYNALAREVEQVARQVEELGNEIDGLRARITRLVGAVPMNLAAGEERLAELRREKEQVEVEVEALTLAYHELNRAAQEFQATHRQRLAERATENFAILAGVAGRRVEIGEDFHIYLSLDNGKTAEVVQLSQGAQDQLYLALRLAIADLLSGDLVLPFIFDDPFLNFDERRLEFARQAIQRLSTERQVLLFSHRREFLNWLPG